MITVRPARSGDIEHLVGLLKQLFSIEEDFCFNKVKQRIGLEMLLESPGAMVMVAEDDHGVVGMVSGQLVVSTAEGSRSLLVEDLVVAAASRGQGIGGRLLEALGAWAAGKNVRRMQLLADRDNHKALTFYHRSGWQKTNMICLRSYYQEHDHENLEFSRDKRLAALSQRR